ncbi:hypothetical protein LTR84_002060 [Exophiala bonariae]|uniref:Uncharacterized protein n=1 Tax=Exophiala bonariae TaxID=1690606 RepID=A0AAV9NA67_9EURO|nr:hypothetical protein LTR84_002060 [Exophiala bonariae]
MVLVEDSRGAQAQSQSPTRPGSAWTSNSFFADSAISLRTSTPKPFDDDTNTAESFDPVTHLSDRLRGLVSEIWASEQDGALRGSKRRRIEAAMDDIETALIEDDNAAVQGEDDHNEATQSTNQEEVLVTQELELIRTNLTLTIESMRMRQQEQSHLHELTMEKLEAVAQRCVQQETRLRDFRDEIKLLKERNRQLSRENVDLGDQLEHSRAESRKRDDAVHAMSSAVAGLNGWINSTSPASQPARKIVVRGRGRFRGRYYVDEPEEGPTAPGLAAASDARTIHEGVNAWLRGFSDIEQELESIPIGMNAHAKQADSRSIGHDEDDWGEFETVSGI